MSARSDLIWRLADEVIIACKLARGPRGTIAGACGDAYDAGRLAGIAEAEEMLRKQIALYPVVEGVQLAAPSALNQAAEILRREMDAPAECRTCGPECHCGEDDPSAGQCPGCGGNCQTACR